MSRIGFRFRDLRNLSIIQSFLELGVEVRFSSLVIFSFVVPVLLTSSAFSDSTVTAVLIEEAPKIDGVTDDPAWKKATPVTDFFQREPNPGQPVSERTEVLVCYDLDRLYIAFRCNETDPTKITAKELARDVSLGEDDRVQVILDTFLDGRNGYWFQIGPRGSIGDALVSDNGAGFNKEWDGLWEGKAKIHSHGWDGELAIPFKTLSFQPNQPRWGMKPSGTSGGSSRAPTGRSPISIPSASRFRIPASSMGSRGSARESGWTSPLTPWAVSTKPPAPGRMP